MGDGMNETPPKPRRPIGVYVTSVLFALFAGRQIYFASSFITVHDRFVLGIGVIYVLVSIGIFNTSRLARFGALILLGLSVVFAALDINYEANLALHGSSEITRFIGKRLLLVQSLWFWPPILILIYFLMFDRKTVAAFKNAGRKVIGDGH